MKDCLSTKFRFCFEKIFKPSNILYFTGIDNQFTDICICNQNFDLRTFAKYFGNPSKLEEILSNVKTVLWTSNANFDLVICRLHLYHNMQLVIFGVDKDKNLIIQFPVFIQPYTQPLILYQLETAPVPIIDQNTQAQTYTHLQGEKKPYITLNSETHISI